MQVIDPGHRYKLDSLDGECYQHLVFVKREGEKYPGNRGHHPGTTMQDVMRCLLERIDYVNGQLPCKENELIKEYLELAITLLERRAASRHGRTTDIFPSEAVHGSTCGKCGHIRCNGSCHPNLK